MSTEQTDAAMLYDHGALPINSPYNTQFTVVNPNNETNNKENKTMNNTTTFAAPTTPRVDVDIDFKALTGGMRDDAGRLDFAITNGREALREGNADFQVARVSMEQHPVLGHSTNAHKHYFIIKDDDSRTILGRSVSPGYNMQQNDVLADIGDHVVAAFGGTYSNVIVKGSGEEVGLTVKLPMNTYIGDGREIVNRLTLLKGHGGVRNIIVVAHGLDLFCTNQVLSMIRNGQTVANISHTASADIKLEGLHRVILGVLRHQDEWNDALIGLLNTEARLATTLDSVFGRYPNMPAAADANEAARIQRRWEERRTAVVDEYQKDFNDHVRGTAFGVLMAFQGREEHIDGNGNMRTEQQKIGRFCKQTQPLAEKAYAALTA